MTSDKVLSDPKFPPPVKLPEVETDLPDKSKVWECVVEDGNPLVLDVLIEDGVPIVTTPEPIIVVKFIPFPAEMLVTVPFPFPVPAPIAVLKSLADRALTVLSALNLGNVIADGLAKVNID